MDTACTHSIPSPSPPLLPRDRVTRLEVMRRGVGHRLTDALVAALGLLWLLAQLSFAW